MILSIFSQDKSDSEDEHLDQEIKGIVSTSNEEINLHYMFAVLRIYLIVIISCF